MNDVFLTVQRMVFREPNQMNPLTHVLAVGMVTVKFCESIHVFFSIRNIFIRNMDLFCLKP